MATVKYTGVGNVHPTGWKQTRSSATGSSRGQKTPTETKVQILSNGTVRYGNVNYTGNAVIPNSGGLTANQLQQESLRQAKSVNPNIKAGTYTATLTQSEAQQIATSLAQQKEVAAKAQEAARIARQEQIKQATSAKANLNKPQAIAPKPITITPTLKSVKGGGTNYITPAQKKILENIAKRETDYNTELQKFKEEQQQKYEPKPVQNIQIEPNPIFKNPMKGGGCVGRDYASCNVGQKINKVGEGSLTMAMDIGGGLMQDIKIDYKNGVITKVGEANRETAKPISETFRQIVEQEKNQGSLVLGFPSPIKNENSVFNRLQFSPRLTEAEKKQVGENIIRVGKDILSIPGRIGQFKEDVQPLIPEFLKEGKQYIKSGEMKLDIENIKQDVNKYFIPESVRQAKADIKESASVFHEKVTEAAMPFRENVDTFINAVEGTYLPTFLNDQFYLPDKASKEKFNKEVEKSNIALIDIKDGKVSFNTNPDLKANNRLRELSKESQDQFQKDVAKLEKMKADAEFIINTKQFKKIEEALPEQERKLNEIRNRQNITQKDVDEYNKEYATYKKMVDQINSGYDKYRYKMELANEFVDYMNKGMIGTGWDYLTVAVEKEKARTGRDATLATLALKAGMEGYNLEKTALAFQIGGGVIGKTSLGQAIGRGLATPIIGQQSIGSIASSTPAVLGTAGLIGTTSGLKEYQKSGNLGYAVAAGLGTAGAFTSIVALPAAFPTQQAKYTKFIKQSELEKLAKAKGVANADVYKYSDKEFKVTTYETQKTSNLWSTTKTEYQVRIIDNRPVVQKGEGVIQITDAKTGEILRKNDFSFIGHGEVLTDKKVSDIIQRMQVMKGKLTVNLEKNIANKDFLGLGIKQKNILYSFTDKWDASKIKIKLDFKDITNTLDTNLKSPKTETHFNYEVGEKKFQFSPQTIAEVRTPTGEELGLRLGGPSRRLDKVTEFITEPFVKPESISKNIDTFTKNLKGGTPTYDTFKIMGGGGLPKSGKISLPTLRGFGATPSTTNEGLVKLPELKSSIGTDSILLSSFGQEAGLAALETQKLIYPFYNISPILAGAVVTKDEIKEGPGLTLTGLDIKTKTKREILPSQIDITSQSSDVTPDVASSTRSSTSSKTVQETITEVVTEPVVPIVVPRPRPPSPRPPQPPIIGIPSVPDFVEETKKQVYQGYYAEYLPENGKKFERLNKQPETLGSALSTMARKVDKFRSTVGRVVAAKPIVKKKHGGKSPIKDTKDNYYKRNKNKFRTYSLTKGVKGLIQSGTFIEKEEYRNDSPLEKVKKGSKKLFRL